MIKNRPIYWVVFGALFLFIALMWLSPQKQDFNPEHLPWNAHYDTQGELHALGLTLDRSTLKDAMNLYGRDIEIKLFEMQDGQKSAEAYFGSMYIGSIHGALVLKLALSEAELDAYFQRGARTTITQQGTREVQLNNEDTLALFNHAIYEATLVPRRNLTPTAIEKRFGQADAIEQDEANQLSRWWFRDKGLELILLDGGNDILRYRSLKDN
ncbi:MAG: hypothetical protein RBS36_06830 [Thiomicrospira sp.]|jgi:hypothetical protein|nr:hypothetical protein [Thiomicrospira sp.]